MNGIGDKSPQAPDAAPTFPCPQRYLMMIDRLFPARAAPRPGARDGAGGDSIDRDELEAQRARLAAALTAEARRGAAGHWSFDANRLLALRQASDQCHALLDAAGPGRAEERTRRRGKRKNAAVGLHGGVRNSV